MDEVITDKRLRSISVQLVDVIRVLCNKSGADMTEVLNTYTNITGEEYKELLRRGNNAQNILLQRIRK